MSVTLQPPQQQQQPHPAENDNSWSDDIEYILETIRLNSTNYSRAYKKYYFLLKGRLSYFRVPIVVISAINGVVSVGLQQYIPQNVISLTTCALGLVCSIIGSIELYLSVQKTMENALSRYKDFYLLAVDIYKTLQLQRHHRPYPAKEYLDQIFNLYVKYAENSDPIYEDIRDKLTPLAPKPPSRWRSLFSSAASPASPASNALVLSRPTSSSVSRSRPSSAESTARIRRHDSNSIFSSGGDDDTSTYEHKDGGNEEENIEEEYFIERIGNTTDNTAAATVNAPSYLGGRKRSFNTTQQQQRYLNLGDWIRPSSATSGGTQVDVESQQQQQQQQQNGHSSSSSSSSSDDEPLGDFNAGNNYHMYTHGIRHRTRHNNTIHLPTQSTSQMTPHYSFNKIVVEPVANLLSSAFATTTVNSNSDNNNNINNNNSDNNNNDDDNKEVTKVQTYDHHEPFLTPLPQPRAFVSQYPTLTPTLVQTTMQQPAMQQTAMQQQSIDVTSISPSSLSPPASPPQSPNASSFSPTIDSITITQPSNEPDSTANVNADD